MTIIARVLHYGSVTEEKPFKDTDDDKALAWGERQVADAGLFEDGLEVEIWWKGAVRWKSSGSVEGLGIIRDETHTRNER